MSQTSAFVKNDTDEEASSASYTTLSSKLGVSLPLDSFEKEVLTIANMVSVQLHLNCWTFLRVFCILFYAPILGLFLLSICFF